MVKLGRCVVCVCACVYLFHSTYVAIYLITVAEVQVRFSCNYNKIWLFDLQEIPNAKVIFMSDKALKLRK